MSRYISGAISTNQSNRYARSSLMKPPRPNTRWQRACALAAFAFAVSPSVGIFAYEASERMRFAAENLSRGGGAVAIGAPPAWVFALGSLALALPWLVAGCFSLVGRRWALWLHVVLTLPTVPVILLTVAGLGNAWRSYVVDNDRAAIDAVAFLTPICASAMAYCVVVWAMLIALRQSSPSAAPIDERTTKPE